MLLSVPSTSGVVTPRHPVFNRPALSAFPTDSQLRAAVIEPDRFEVLPRIGRSHSLPYAAPRIDQADWVDQCAGGTVPAVDSGSATRSLIHSPTRRPADSPLARSSRNRFMASILIIATRCCLAVNCWNCSVSVFTIGPIDGESFGSADRWMCQRGLPPLGSDTLMAFAYRYHVLRHRLGRLPTSHPIRRAASVLRALR